jgi:uncharacterized protein
MTPAEIPTSHSPARIYVIRLKPREDLKECLLNFALQNRLEAAVVLTCVGSLEQYNLRFANRKAGTCQQGHFEIVSLVGTLSQSSAHLHICLSDEKGQTTAGHLLDKNLIYTTAEIAIAELTDFLFERVPDPASGYPELQVRNK